MNRYSVRVAAVLAAAFLVAFGQYTVPSDLDSFTNSGSSGQESMDLENPIFFKCVIDTCCYLGDEMFAIFNSCFDRSTREDVISVQETVKKFGGVFPEVHKLRLRNEWCEDFDPEQKNKSLRGIVDKTVDRIMLACQVGSSRCEAFRVIVDCVMQLMKKNMDEKKCV